MIASQQGSWPEVLLESVVDLITYGFTNPMPTTDAGPFMVTAKDIRHGRIDYESARHTSMDAYETKLTPKSRPEVGDVLLTKDGSIGRVAVCDRDDICINQSVALLRPSSLITPQYLAYLLQAPRYQEQMERDSGGSTIKHIYIRRVGKMAITLPSLPEQRAITRVLCAIDDKVAENKKLVNTIDLTAGALFRAASDKWLVSPLSDAADFVNGRAFTKGASGTGRVVVRIAELKSGLGASTVYSDAEVADKHVVHAGDILFAWSGTLTLNRWYRDDAIVNQHIFKVIPKEGYPSWLAYELIRAKLPDFKAIAADKATTMGHIQRHHLDEAVRVPTPDAIAQLDPCMGALWQRALAAERESLTLTELRETLLPELMSGRLRVKDAEKKIEEVV